MEFGKFDFKSMIDSVLSEAILGDLREEELDKDIIGPINKKLNDIFEKWRLNVTLGFPQREGKQRFLKTRETAIDYIAKKLKASLK